MPTRVTGIGRQSVNLITADGELTLPFRDFTFAFDELAIGDWLLLQRDTSQPKLILPRSNELVRRASGAVNKPQCLAANLNVVLIVAAADNTFNESRIERCLVLAAQCEVPPVVVLTKVDQNPQTEACVDQVKNLGAQVPVVSINGLDYNSCKSLLTHVSPEQTAALLGSSGVGKTTLVNTLSQQSQLRTQSVRAGDSKGRHTTVRRSLIMLENGGLVIDGPGLREFGLWGKREAIDSVFEDVLTLSRGCKFNDCSHEHEPSCAVQEAIQTGILTQRRVRNFQRLVAEVATTDE